MSCNCGCHNDQKPATGWRRYVPLAITAVIAAAIITGGVCRHEHSEPGTASAHAHTAPQP